MHGLLAVARRAFPREHHARCSDEIVDTAVLAAEGSTLRAAREALSLVVAGTWQRVRAESRRSPREGAALLAGGLALVNLAVAVAGITARVHFAGVRPYRTWSYGPYAVDWWWIAFTVASAGIVLGLTLGSRRLAVGAAFANLGIIAYDVIVPVDFSPYAGRGHLDIFTYTQASSSPAGRQWLAAAVVLALATSVATQAHRSVATRLPLALLVTVALVVLSRETGGAFFFLRWALVAAVVLAVGFGGRAPRLAVFAVGASLAAAPSVGAYLAAPNLQHDSVEIWTVVAALALGVLLPLAQLTRRRLT